jgi:hypothetical protein
VNSYKVFHPKNRQHTIFSAALGTFSKLDHILRHKARVNKFKKIKITPCIIPDHNGTQLDLNNKRNQENLQTHGH